MKLPGALSPAHTLRLRWEMMKLDWRLFIRVFACILPLSVAGCVHRNNTAQVQPLAPPIENTPPPTPSPAPAEIPPPVVVAQSPPPAPEAEAKPAETPKPPVRHKKPVNKPAPAAQQPAQPVQQAAAAENPGVSAIGQLSSGDPSDEREETVHSIADTERGLNGITRGLSEQEQKTAAQIREFLKQAKEALTTGDVDGAHTLAAKAKVLLSELAGT